MLENFTLRTQRAAQGHHKFLHKPVIIPSLAATQDCRLWHGIRKVIQETSLEAQQHEKDLPQLSSKIREDRILHVCGLGLEATECSLGPRWRSYERAAKFLRNCEFSGRFDLTRRVYSLRGLSLRFRLTSWAEVGVGVQVALQATSWEALSPAPWWSLDVVFCAASDSHLDMLEWLLWHCCPLTSLVEGAGHPWPCAPKLFHASIEEVVCSIILVELILTVVWSISEISCLGSASWKMSQTLRSFKAGQSISRLNFPQKQQILISQCSGSKKLRQQRQLATSWHRDRLWREPIFPITICLMQWLRLHWKPLDRHVNFRRRVCVEEQRAQKYDRFLRWRQIALLIYEQFRATSAYEAVQGLSDLFKIRLQNDNVHHFDVRWDQNSIISEWSSDRNGLGRIVHVKITGFCSASDSNGFVDQETSRKNVQPSYQRLKASVSVHIDQTIRAQTSEPGTKLWTKE